MAVQGRARVWRPSEGQSTRTSEDLIERDARATFVSYSRSGRPRYAVSRVIPLAAERVRSELSALCPIAHGRLAAG